MSAILKSRYNCDYQFFKSNERDSEEMMVFKTIVQDDANHLQLLQRLVVNTVFPEWITKKIRAVLISTDITQEIEGVR